MHSDNKTQGHILKDKSTLYIYTIIMFLIY